MATATKKDSQSSPVVPLGTTTITAGADVQKLNVHYTEFLTATVKVPMTLQPPPAQFMLHIDTKLDSKQSTVLRRIARELDCQGAKLANGLRVTETTHALKWLIENIGKSIEN